MRPAALAILLTLLVPPAALAEPPDASRPEQIVQQMLYAQAAMRGPDWWRERIEMVQGDPATFAPLIRERLLSGVPPTLDEYTLDDSQWVMNESSRFPHGAVRPFMRIVALLPLDHAEPILQEFFDRVNPLAIEAERRYWRERDIANAAGMKTGEALVEAKEIYLALAAARGHATNLAKHLDSDIFYDDYVVMLTSDDPVAQETGANYTRGNLDKIIEQRPEFAAQIVEAAARLSASGDARVAEAGRSLTDAVRQTLQSPPRDDTRADPAHQRDS
jgi:hypothetical protein